MQTYVYSFSARYSFTSARLKWLRYFLLTLVICLFSNAESFAEGTKQLEPGGENPTLQLALYRLNYVAGGGWRNPFAIPGCDPEYRLNVTIKDPLIEKIYFGFNNSETEDLFYQIRDTNYVVVVAWTQVPTSGAGFIATWNEAFNGPDIGAMTAGYTPSIYSPTLPGEYYFEFASSASGGIFNGMNGHLVRFFDISVVKSAATVINGRVWSKAWQFGDGSGFSGNSPNTDMFIYADDGIVTRLNINGWDGGHFFINCNPWGAARTGNWIEDRKSFDYGAATPDDFPQYKEFLNDPDSTIFPTGIFGEICDIASVPYCDGTIDFLIRVTKSGSVTLHITTPDGVTDVSGDITGYPGCTTWDTIHWDGITAAGNHVQNGASVSMDIEYLNGLTNLPCNDIEGSPEGIKVDIVRPVPTSGITKLGIMWDDSNIPPPNGWTLVNTIYPGCIYTGTGSPTGCHDFNDGNVRIINSWWYYLTPGNKTLNLVVLNSPATPPLPAGSNPVCQGQSGVTYSIPAQNSTEKYIWFLPDGTTDTTLTPSITIDFGAGAVSGSISVKGYNEDCGYGIPSPLFFITVNPNPVPSITGPVIACQATNSTFSVAAGLTSYLWTVSGGIIVGPTNTNAVNINWTTAGPQTVNVTTTSLTCPNILTSKAVTINPQPTVNFTFANNCALQPVQFTDNSTIASGSNTGWNWSFGDGNTSTLQNPLHTYAAGGTYTVMLTVTSNQSCSANHSVSVPVTSPPTADAGPPIDAFCASGTYTLAAANSSNSPSRLWTSAGTGTFNNNTALNPVYTPSAADIAAGSVILTLTANGNTPCGTTSDAITLTIHPLPIANAGPAGATCQGVNYTVSGATSSNSTTISWTEDGPGSLVNANTLTPTYVPAPGEVGPLTLTLTVNGANTCSLETATSTRALTVNPLPDVDAGVDATICAANTYTLNGTQTDCNPWLWTTAGDGTFSNPNLLNPVYTPGVGDIAAGSVVLTFTGSGTGACLGLFDVDQMTLFIDAMPTANAGIDDAFCVLNPINVTGASATHYTSLQWTAGDGAFNDNTILAPTYMPGNVDFNNGTVTLTLTVQGNLSCSGQFVSDSRVYSVSPYPLVDAGPDDYICSNITQFTLAGTGNNYNLGNIQWTVTGGDGFLSNPNILNPVYFAGPVDLSTTDRNIIFTLTLQGNGNCSGVFVNDQMLLKIDPTPVSNAGPDDEICGQQPYQLNPTAQFQSTIGWTTSGTGTFSNPNILNPTYTPSPADVGTTVVLTLDLSGCKSLTGDDFMWLTVHPDPSATMSGTTGICEGTSTPVSIAFTGTAPWSVTYTDGVTPVTVNNINTSPYTFTVSPAISTTWSVTAANDAFCTVPADSIHGLAAVTVNALPDLFVVTGSNGGYYCEGDTGVMIGLNNSQVGMTYTLLRNGLSAGVTLAGTGFPIVFGLFTTPGQYSVQGENPVGNCFAMMRDTINVVMNPTPVTDFTTNTACYGDTTYFTLSGNFLPRTSSWHWEFGDGTFATFNAPFSPSHVYPAPSIYTVILSVIDTNGCSYTVTHPVEILPHPAAFFSFSTPNCLDGTTQFTDLSNNPGGQGYLQQWIWTFGDGSPADTIYFPDSPNVTHNYLAQGNYNVTLTVNNSKGCSDLYQSVVTVSNRPLAGFNSWTSCEDQAAAFADISDENLGGQITAWLWNFGDPTSGAMNFSTLEDPTHIFSAPGTFTVTLIVTNLNGCSDTAQKIVNVNAAPLSNFFVSPACLVSPTLFLADSTLINIPATATYLWDFGDGATASSRNASHTYLAPGIYTVIFTITDTAGCVGDTSLPVTVNPPPVAHFTANTDNCQGQAVAFTNLSTSPTGFINQWIWNYGDGNSDTLTFPANANTNHSYAGAGTFSVTLTVTNNEGCTHSESRLVNILGAPTSDFMSAGQCAGTAVAFTDLTTVSGTQTISSWQWNFGDPTSGVNNTSTQKNPSHTYAGAGTYSVTLITFTGNNCSDTAFKTITIKPIPVVGFNALTACAGNPASFVPSGMAVATIATWYWTFGDGGNSTVQAPTHVYTSPGTYTVTLTVTDTAGCSNTHSNPLVIAPLPDANFGYTTPTCQGDAVSFADMSSTLSGFIARWEWDFGDGNTQTINFPSSPDITHQYANAGTFNVTLTVKTNDSCTNEITRVVTILPKPSSDFMHGAACQGNAVAFNDLSTSNTSGTISGWQWNFGDPTSGTGNTSGLQNPTHIYNTAGTFTVSLIVFIPGGCSDTATHPVTVSPPPSVDFTSVAGCNGDTTQFTSTVNLATTQGWYWQFGDGGTSFVANPVHSYATAGTYNVTLTITDTAGCTNVKVKPVTVIPGPLAAFSSSSPSCSGQGITFTDLSNANGGSLTTWNWDFGDGTDTTYTGFIAAFEHVYAQPGTFNVTLQVLSAQGCEHAVQHTVSVSPAPIAGFGYANTCQGQSTQFTDETDLNGGSSLTLRAWNFGDPGSGILNTSTQVNPIHTYAQPGQYVVTLVTLNAGGCGDTVQQTVSITPKPGLDFYADSLVCLGNITTLYTDTLATNTGMIQQYEWDFGDGSPHAFTQNASHQYSVAGTFTVTLTVQDTAGCENVKAHPLTIHTAPVSAFTYEGVCENAPVQFTDLSTAPTGETIVSWYWDFGIAGSATDTSTSQNPTFTFTAPATYTISLTTWTENGCSNLKTQSLQVWNTPTAYFNYSASPCANGLVQFQDSSWSYQGTVNSWQWEFEPYQFGTGTNPTHQYYAVDSCYNVKLAIEDMRGCLDTIIQQVCVPPVLTVDFNTSLTCFGDPVSFSPQLLTPAAPADSLVAFSWNFGDPVTGNNNVSTQKTPAHTFSSVGFYSVNFTATDQFGCTATTYKTVKVNALPVAGFSYTNGQCDSTLVFSSTSVDTSSVVNTWIWNYGDGTSDTTTVPASTHKYSAPGDYLATLTVINANGCMDVFTDSVTRSACLVAAYLTVNGLQCQNQNLTFADMSTCDGTITQWNWNFGDGTPPTTYGTYQPTVNHTYVNAGIYTISLKVSTLVGASTLSDSTAVDILVKPTPVAGFLVEPVCLGEETAFSDTTQANGASALYFQWEFGDAGTSDTSNLKNPDYLYPVPGSYTAQMIVQNQFGCADTATSAVTVNGLPGASFANSLACSGQQTYFFDASQPYIAPLSQWGWRVSDNVMLIGSMQGSTPNFVFDTTGMFSVMLTVADSNGCADTIVQPVSVNASPVSAFSYTENMDSIQGQVQFTNGSIGAQEYYWDFGNGETSYAASPLITYATDGTYQVMLVTVGADGCQDTATLTYDLMYKGLYVPNAFAPGGTIQPTRIWKPVGVNLASYNAEIYNSQGMMIWSSTALDASGAPQESWDGTYNEKPCQQDVYVWKITAVFRDGSVWANQDVGKHDGMPEVVYGTITLIR